MAVLGIVWLILVPYFLGALILGVLRERKTGNLERFVTGFLSLFMFFYFCLLVTVKFDVQFLTFQKMFIIPVTVLAVSGVYFGIKDFEEIKIGKDNIFVVLTAVLLAGAAYGIFAPSYVNDDTFEIVATTLSTNSIYEYSAMTGEKMINGLPLFNKIYMMPMFFSTVCGFFKLSMQILGGIVFPAMVFSLTIGIIYKISGILNIKSRQYFTLVYMMIMVAGTYLTKKGIPVTTGYAVLREGYSGYAVAYGIVLPFVLYLFLKKRFLFSVLPLFLLVGLLRTDRIMYALFTPVEAYRDINSAGKLFLLYFVSVLFALAVNSLGKSKVDFKAFLIPGVAISFCAATLLDKQEEKNKKLVCIIGTVFAILLCCNMQPFSDASFRMTEYRERTSVSETLEHIENGAKIWAPENFSYEARRLRGDVRTAYGRDDYSLCMAGLDYEDKTPYTDDYRDEIGNLVRGQVFYPFEHDEEEVFEAALSEGVDYIILPEGDSYRIVSAKDYLSEILTPELAPWR